jgi:hypothetical protein
MAATALALLGLHATLIAVKGGQTECPSTHQVNEAVAARLPGVLVPLEPKPAEGVLVLQLAGGTGKPLGFTLVDPKGEVRLERTLPAARNASAGDCAALAETVALIVERYLQDLGYQDRAISPPRVTQEPVVPRWEVFLGATWQPGEGGLAGYEAQLGVGRVLGRRGSFLLEITGGIRGRRDESWSGGVSGQLWRLPLELRFLERWSLNSSLNLEAGPFAGAHLLMLLTDSERESSRETHVSPVAGLAAGLRVTLGEHAFIRLLASGGVAIVRYKFTTPPGATEVFGTDRVYGKMSVETGLSFW